MNRKITVIRLIIVVGMLMALAGCGTEVDGNEGAVASEQSGENEALAKQEDEQKSSNEMVEEDSSITVTTSFGTYFFDEIPTRIVAVIPADLEILFAIGAGDYVIGRSTSRGPVVPSEASSLEEVGNAHTLDFEKLASLDPDVVIGHGRLNAKDVETVEALGATMLLTAMDSYEDIIDTILMYGQLTGEEEGARKLVESMNDKVNAIKNSHEDDKPKALLVHGTTESFTTLLPNSLVGDIAEIAGIENVATDFPKFEDNPTHAQLSLEHIMVADPEVIYIVTHGEAEEVEASFLKELSTNPAWNNLSAVKNERIFVLPAHLFAVNPGPRVIEAIQFLHNSVER